MALEENNDEAVATGLLPDENFCENVSIGNYIIDKELGSGSTAKVVLAFDKDTKKRVAIKIVSRKDGNASIPESDEKSGFNDERIYREVVVSVLLDHPHIVKLLDFIYSSSYFFLVFEYVKGQQLYDVILKGSSISEERARKYFRQILSAVDYTHRNSVVHRDLKIENIIVDDNDNIKILDFGLANFYDNKIFLKTCCGSLYFAAPELLLGEQYFGPEVDVWSLGVILYVILCGRVPFDDESVKELQNKIKTAHIEFPVSLTRQAQDLISNMVVPDVLKRLTMNEVLDSKWVNAGYAAKVESYIGKRFPLLKLNSEYVRAICSVLSFQFENGREHIDSFFAICKNNTESLDKMCWFKNPVVSMYYLLSENVGLYAKMSADALKFDDNADGMPEKLHRFVRFVFSNDSAARPSKFFFRGVFQDSETEAELEEKKTKACIPSVQKSYIKGLFHGIRVRHIGSQKALKQMILDIFRKNSIIFEAAEKGYFCSFYCGEDECYFKVSLYYNVIMSEYYLVLKCLNNKGSSFKSIYSTIENSLKYKA